MDRFDKWTVFITAVILLYAAGLLVRGYENSNAGKSAGPVQQSRQFIVNPRLDQEIELAKNLMLEDNLEKSEVLVDNLIEENPYEGRLYMLRGDILMRRQKPVDAMYEYKEAVSLNPDFLDKKTKYFQGKKIERTVEEAMTAIESRLQQNPGDSQLKDDRQVMYFMRRKLAGSCG